MSHSTSSGQGAAYFNENNGYAAGWLRELMRAGVIADGEVDERDIRQVEAADLRGFTQCHFFAGIGVWSYALRRAGWRDDEPVWTGSCPCPPFSVAGRKKTCPNCHGENLVSHVGRTGFFVCCACSHEWHADERHLWPEMWRLIRDGRPGCFFGEQVASSAGRTWLASVRASMEILGYAVGPADLCAAGAGAPHQRQRLYFVADAELSGRRGGRTGEASDESGAVERPARLREAGELVHPEIGGERPHNRESRPGRGQQVAAGRSSVPGELGDTAESGPLPGAQRRVRRGEEGRGSRDAEPQRRGATNGFWSGADWVLCRPRRPGAEWEWRPVKPGTFPLVAGAPARVGRLRGYGNALVAPLAEEFIRAYREQRSVTA